MDLGGVIRRLLSSPQTNKAHLLVGLFVWRLIVDLGAEPRYECIAGAGEKVCAPLVSANEKTPQKWGL